MQLELFTPATRTAAPVPVFTQAEIDARFAAMVAEVAGITIDLRTYDIVLVNSSAGKDSQAMLTFLVALAKHQGVSLDRFIVVHADLGRAEWDGTRELAEQQAAAYGIRFEVVRRDEDLPDQVRTRRRNLDAQAATLDAESMVLRAAGWDRLADLAAELADKRRETPAWPSSQARYCTSDQKTSQVAKLMTRLVDDRLAAGHVGPVRILNCLGIRAAESRDRAKKTAFGRDSESNSKRAVDRWLPIFDWSDEDVWATIRGSGLPYHRAYDEGMPRLSCVFCVLAGHRELVLAARLNPGLAAEYVDVEREVGHTFKADLSMAQIAAEAGVTV